MTLAETSNSQERNQRRLVVARLQLADLETPSASIVKLDQVTSHERVHTQTFLDLPEGYGISTEGLPGDSVTGRMLEILAVEPLRGQKQTEDSQRDDAANMLLMLMLAKHRGYDAILAGIQPGFDKSKLHPEGTGFRELNSLEDLQASLDRFFDTLVEGGCVDVPNVYLSRSTPSDGDFNVAPFEIMVSRGRIGWKLPEILVASCLQGARLRSEAVGHQPRDRHAA